MARPRKRGIDYFPLDVGFFEDMKVRRIKKDCGINSIPILIVILCWIYRDDGFFVGVNDDLTFLIAEQLGISQGAVEDTVRKAVQVDFFDADMFHKYQILTSAGIQKRYFKAVSERKDVEVPGIFVLTSVSRPDNVINRPDNPVNPPDNEQRIVKDSKAKKRKASTDEADAPSRFDAKKFIAAWNENGLNQIVTLNRNTKRYGMLKARIDEFGEDAVLVAISKVGKSSFLKGQNQRKWSANFDWFILPNNFPKVLEGNYDDKEGEACGQTKSQRAEELDEKYKHLYSDI